MHALDRDAHGQSVCELQSQKRNFKKGDTQNEAHSLFYPLIRCRIGTIVFQESDEVTDS